MRLKSLCIAAALTVLPVTASAAPYAIVNITEGSAMLLDRATIRNSGAGRTAWYYMIFDAPDDFGAVYYNAKYEYDCIGEKSRKLFGQRYDAEGLPKGDAQSAPGEWTPVAPKTIGEGLLREACSAKAVHPTLPAYPDVPALVADVRKRMDSPKVRAAIQQPK